MRNIPWPLALFNMVDFTGQERRELTVQGFDGVLSHILMVGPPRYSRGFSSSMVQ